MTTYSAALGVDMDFNVPGHTWITVLAGAAGSLLTVITAIFVARRREGREDRVSLSSSEAKFRIDILAELKRVQDMHTECLAAQQALRQENVEMVFRLNDLEHRLLQFSPDSLHQTDHPNA